METWKAIQATRRSNRGDEGVDVLREYATLFGESAYCTVTAGACFCFFIDCIMKRHSAESALEDFAVVWKGCCHKNQRNCLKTTKMMRLIMWPLKWTAWGHRCPRDAETPVDENAQTMQTV